MVTAKKAPAKKAAPAKQAAPATSAAPAKKVAPAKKAAAKPVKKPAPAASVPAPPPPPENYNPPAAPELPPCPRLDWAIDASVLPSTITHPRSIDQPFHPTDCVYFDAIAGELRGQEAITNWLADMSARSTNDVFVPLGPLLSDGATTVQEWKTMVPGPDGQPTTMRGTSVRRLVDGCIVYAADYYDTATF